MKALLFGALYQGIFGNSNMNIAVAGPCAASKKRETKPEMRV